MLGVEISQNIVYGHCYYVQSGVLWKAIELARRDTNAFFGITLSVWPLARSWKRSPSMFGCAEECVTVGVGTGMKSTQLSLILPSSPAKLQWPQTNSLTLLFISKKNTNVEYILPCVWLENLNCLLLVFYESWTE